MGIAHSISNGGCNYDHDCDCANLHEDKFSVVKNFDPIRYQGEWWEIAKYPIIWEKDCEYAKAEYTWNRDSKRMKVVNICYRDDMLIRTREGEARLSDDKYGCSKDGMLFLRFTDGLPSEPGEAPYLVHWTDYDDIAIVGGTSGDTDTNCVDKRSSNKEYLWILSRQKNICKVKLSQVMKKASKFGYDCDKLEVNKKLIKECDC